LRKARHNASAVSLFVKEAIATKCDQCSGRDERCMPFSMSFDRWRSIRPECKMRETAK